MIFRNAVLFVLLALAVIFDSSCRHDTPPVIGIICTLDGFGGGNCVLSDGTKVYKSPSEMKNFWATTQVDQANFSAWCYHTTPAVTNAALDRMKLKMTSPDNEKAQIEEIHAE